MQRLKGLAAGLPQSTSSDSMQFEPPKKPPMDSLTIDDVADSLKMCLVDKGGYLIDIPDEKVGHFYSGDSYVIFCKYKVSCINCTAVILC